MKEKIEKIEKQVDENTNGLKAVQLQMESMSYIRRDLTLLMESMEDMKEAKESNEKVAEFLSHLKWGKKTIIGLLAFLGSIVGLLLGFKELMK